MSVSELEQLQICCNDLQNSQQTLLLASRRSDGNVDISYAPYLRKDGAFYIFISDLATHTHNLLTHPQTSILFIQPETEADNLFARQRLTFDCQVQEIMNTEARYPLLLDAMSDKFGKIFALLRSLPDFHLLELLPKQGQFVAGFGQAFVVDAIGCIQRPNRTN